MDNNLDAFISALTALTLKHRVIVGGCGCCDSPYFMGIDNEKQFELIAGNLKFDRDTEVYSIDLPEQLSAHLYEGTMYNGDGTECERFDSDLSVERAKILSNTKVVDPFRNFNKSRMYQEVCMVAGEVFCARTDDNGELYIKVHNENKEGMEAYYRLGLDKNLSCIRSSYPENDMTNLHVY